MGRVFVHSGKLGDVVFALPAFRASGCESMLLVDSGAVGHWAYRPELVAPLVRAQGINVVVARGGGVVPAEANWCNGDQFRGPSWGRRRPVCGRALNLAERALDALGLPLGAAAVAWLAVEPLLRVRFALCRSARYRPAGQPVDWAALADLWRGECVILGTAEEAAALRREVRRDVDWMETADLLTAAQVIAGTECVAVNQTSLQAVCCGLHHPHVLECAARIDCCRFDGAWQQCGSSGVLLGAGPRRS